MRRAPIGPSAALRFRASPRFRDPRWEAFGPRLRRIREALRFSQEPLAQALGRSQRMIAYYETHRREAARAPSHRLGPGPAPVRRRAGRLRPTRVPADRANPRLWRKLRQVEAPSPAGSQAGPAAHRHPRRARDPQEAHDPERWGRVSLTAAKCSTPDGRLGGRWAPCSGVGGQCR